MVNRVAVEREERFADVLIDFVRDEDTQWPDLIEVTADKETTRVRLRVHPEEVEVLAVALDSAATGGDGELYFRPEAT